MKLLKLSHGNHKLRLLARYLGVKYNQVVAVDIPAGYTCKKADICKTFANPATGELLKRGRVTCFAARSEHVFKNKQAANWYNYRLLLACGTDVYAILALLEASIPNKVKYVRIHSYGDYYCKEYFQAWLLFAERHPEMTLFGYTKELDYALADKADNFSLQYSFGSDDDKRYLRRKNKPATCFIGEYDKQYPYKTVCGSHETAHEDFFAIRNGETFVIGEH